MKKITSIKEGIDLLTQFIPSNPSQKFQGEFGLKRASYLLKLLGDPQEKVKVIHIAGTSGKGSTAYLISHLLLSLGFSTGLQLSPYLVDTRERFQVNNQLISEEEFIRYFNTILPYIEEMQSTQFGAPTYFEIVVALGFVIFADKKVDYAVVETGLGGLYDATNTVKNKDKLAVITKIGLDHTEILGETLDKIAYQKSMIMQQGNIAVSTWQDRAAVEVIDSVAQQQNVKLYYLRLDNIKSKKSELDQTVFDLQFRELSLSNIELSMIGEYQEENCAVALATVYLLSQRDTFFFDEQKIRNSLKHAHFSGRMDVLHIHGKTIILDGAHNPQKMSALIRSLQKLYPNQKFDFLVGFKKGKDASSMLEMVSSYAQNIIITSFFSHMRTQAVLAQDPQQLTQSLEEKGFKEVRSVPDTMQAYHEALNKTQNILVITGSLYLLSSIYEQLKKSGIITL